MAGTQATTIDDSSRGTSRTSGRTALHSHGYSTGFNVVAKGFYYVLKEQDKVLKKGFVGKLFKIELLKRSWVLMTI